MKKRTTCTGCRFLIRTYVRDIIEVSLPFGGTTTTLGYIHRCSKDNDIKIIEESFDSDDYLNLQPNKNCPLNK